MAKRKDYLDIAKGIAMLWIISVHADGAPYTGTVGYVLLIPLFFLTAGFLWKDKDEPVLSQLKKRAKPLLRPYFGYNAALLVLYVLDWVPSFLDQKRAFLKDILKHVFGIFYSEGVILFSDKATSLHYFTNYNYPLWFLTAMVTASAAFLLLLWLRRHFGWKLSYLVLPCLILTVLLNHLPLRLPWNLNNCFLAAALMAAGYGIRQKDLLERSWQHRWLEPTLYILAAGAVLAIGIWNKALTTSMLMSAYGPHGDWGVLIYFIGGVLGPCVLLRLCRLLEPLKISKVFLTLGQNTIPILALHRTIITYYNRLWSHFVGAQPELSTPQWFLFSVPRLLIAAAGSMGLIYLGRFMKKKYLALRKSPQS
jgi:fucose 4-O-acetylase-like acetyltransferase